MKILISGSSGLIGSKLVNSFLKDSNQVVKLVRSGGSLSEGNILWDPEKSILDRSSLENFDVVIHLAGENIGSGRWTASKKKAIYDSRIKSTELLCSNLRILNNPPKVAIFASAIGYYGNRSDKLLDENDSPGSGFLAQTVIDWEAASIQLEETSIRRVLLRIGPVLSNEGGMLAKLLPIFKSGLGGKIGSGEQYISWIALDDIVSSIRFVIDSEQIQNAINLVSPNPVTNKEFTRVLAETLNRPSIATVPKFVIKRILGESADELILASTRVSPKKLLENGYTFQHTDLADTLKKIILDN